MDQKELDATNLLNICSLQSGVSVIAYIIEKLDADAPISEPHLLISAQTLRNFRIKLFRELEGIGMAQKVDAELIKRKQERRVAGIISQKEKR